MPLERSTTATAFSVTRRDHEWLMIRHERLGVTSWELPGGHVEPGETLEQAAARESLEETGVSIDVTGLLAVCVHEWHERFQRKLICFFDAVADAEAAPRLSFGESEIREAWLDPFTLPLDNVSPFLHPLLEQQRRGWCDVPISYSMVHQRNPAGSGHRYQPRRLGTTALEPPAHQPATSSSAADRVLAPLDDVETDIPSARRARRYGPPVPPKDEHHGTEQTPPGPPSQQWLAALEADRRSASLADPVPPGHDKERFSWALEVLTAFLGTDWLRRELAMRRPGQGYLLLGGGTTTKDEYPDDVQLRAYRAVTLAQDLLQLQHVSGFVGWLAQAARRPRLRDAAAELQAVKHMARVGTDVGILPADAASGKRPDAKFPLDGVEVWVEVKAEDDRPSPAFTVGAVTSTLKKAAWQLPQDAPGLVYMYLPYAWGDDPLALPGADTAARSWLRHHRRVNAVAVMLERRLQIPNGTRFRRAMYTIPHPSPRYPLRSVQSWLSDGPA